MFEVIHENPEAKRWNDVLTQEEFSAWIKRVKDIFPDTKLVSKGDSRWHLVNEDESNLISVITKK